jgi:hypothetical protein
MATARQFNVTESEAFIRSSLEGTMVHPSVANNAERNQVVHHIATQFTPGFHVMDLQVFHGTALLAAPTIPLQHLLSKEGVVFGI